MWPEDNWAIHSPTPRCHLRTTLSLLMRGLNYNLISGQSGDKRCPKQPNWRKLLLPSIAVSSSWSCQQTTNHTVGLQRTSSVERCLEAKCRQFPVASLPPMIRMDIRKGFCFVARTPTPPSIHPAAFTGFFLSQMWSCIHHHHRYGNHCPAFNLLQFSFF